jgi:NAD(P)-dependent dehydrogenase (short-subunit alcohol dehydrogenase family)
LYSDFQKLGIQTIDILIGNAGISNKDHPKDPVLKCDPEEMMKIFETNVCGNLRLLQTFTPMLLNGSLKLVLLMSSNQGSYDYAVHTHESDPVGYRVSKTALNMLSVVYAIDPEVKQAGVKVLIMHPGKCCSFPRGFDFSNSIVRLGQDRHGNCQWTRSGHRHRNQYLGNTPSDRTSGGLTVAQSNTKAFT